MRFFRRIFLFSFKEKTVEKTNQTGYQEKEGDELHPHGDNGKMSFNKFG
jgi:hypothetical protein